MDSLPLQGYEEAFEKLFTDWFGELYTYAFSLLKEGTIAEEVVQSVFCRIWEKREQLQVHTSVKAYLYSSVYHESLNWLRQEKRTADHRRRVLRNGESARAAPASDKIELNELEKKLRQAIDELPEQCRVIFHLSRFGGYRYREIAEQLGISIKTVETQMTKALKQLRKKMVDFLE